MAKTNHVRIGEGLDLLNDGLQPFVERELKAHYDKKWTETVQQILNNKAHGKGKIHWDSQALLTVMWDQWNTVFRNTLGPAERSLVSELRDIRNRWAHQKAFNSDDGYRALDSIERLKPPTSTWTVIATGIPRSRQSRVWLTTERTNFSNANMM